MARMARSPGSRARIGAAVAGSDSRRADSGVGSARDGGGRRSAGGYAATDQLPRRRLGLAQRGRLRAGTVEAAAVRDVLLRGLGRALGGRSERPGRRRRAATGLAQRPGRRLLPARAPDVQLCAQRRKRRQLDERPFHLHAVQPPLRGPVGHPAHPVEQGQHARVPRLEPRPSGRAALRALRDGELGTVARRHLPPADERRHQQPGRGRGDPLLQLLGQSVGGVRRPWRRRVRDSVRQPVRQRPERPQHVPRESRPGLLLHPTRHGPHRRHGLVRVDEPDPGHRPSGPEHDHADLNPRLPGPPGRQLVRSGRRRATGDAAPNRSTTRSWVA